MPPSDDGLGPEQGPAMPPSSDGLGPEQGPAMPPGSDGLGPEQGPTMPPSDDATIAGRRLPPRPSTSLLCTPLLTARAPAI